MSAAIASRKLSAAPHFVDWDAACHVGAFWHLLYVKSRQERLLARELTVRRISNYLPERSRKTDVKSSGRIASDILFPGYLFLLGTLEQVYDADRTGRVVDIIRVADQMNLMRELTHLRMGLSSELNWERHSYLKNGMRVQVSDGPLKGLEGVVENQKAMDRIILQVRILTESISMEIDSSLLEPLL